MATSWQPGADVVVPDHEATEFRAKGSRYCLCVFVLNEGPRIIAQIARMQPIASEIDIVIADGGSSDGALDPALLSRAGIRTLLVKRGEGRLGAQMRMGFAWALREGYEGVIAMDGNNKDDPTAAPRFVQALDAGFDHIQGSRFVRGGIAVNTPWARWAGIRFVHAPLISLAAGSWYTDTTNGFRGYSRRLLLDPRVAPFRAVFSGYELHYYLAIRAARLGFRVTEVPVRREYPPAGPIPTKISGVHGNLGVLRTLIRACLGRYNPEQPGQRVEEV